MTRDAPRPLKPVMQHQHGQTDRMKAAFIAAAPVCVMMLAVSGVAVIEHPALWSITGVLGVAALTLLVGATWFVFALLGYRVYGAEVHAPRWAFLFAAIGVAVLFFGFGLVSSRIGRPSPQPQPSIVAK